jgi:DNA-binding transcriptional ArsR family regulator
MVNSSTTQLDSVFGALSDATRRAILERLALGEVTVTELASPFASSLPAVSKHLRVLEEAGLIDRRRYGRQRICSLKPAAMDGAAEWLDYYRRFWTARFDALDQVLKEDSSNSTEEDLA